MVLGFPAGVFERPRNLSLLSISALLFLLSPDLFTIGNARTPLHQDQRVIRSAADGALHVIREVALEDAHPSPLVIGHDVSRQGAIVTGTLVDGLEVGRYEGGDGVPSVDLGLALVAEEERATVVRAQDDQLLRFWTAVVYLAVGVTAPEMIRADGEQTAAAQVREEEAGATILVAHQSEIEHVSAIAVRGHRLRKYDAVSTTRGHVVHQDRSRRCVGHVDEDAAVRIVVGHDVLQSGRGARQAGQVDGFHDLKKKYPLNYLVNDREIDSIDLKGKIQEICCLYNPIFVKVMLKIINVMNNVKSVSFKIPR